VECNKHSTGLEKPFGGKHSSFFGPFVNYGRKKVYDIGPRATPVPSFTTTKTNGEVQRNSSTGETMLSSNNKLDRFTEPKEGCQNSIYCVILMF